jgi:hypothetical protein
MIQPRHDHRPGVIDLMRDEVGPSPGRPQPSQLPLERVTDLAKGLKEQHGPTMNATIAVPSASGNRANERSAVADHHPVAGLICAFACNSSPSLPDHPSRRGATPPAETVTQQPRSTASETLLQPMRRVSRWRSRDRPGGGSWHGRGTEFVGSDHGLTNRNTVGIRSKYYPLHVNVGGRHDISQISIVYPR